MKTAQLPIERAAQLAGGKAVLARVLQVSKPTVSQWIHQVPEGRCPAIERLVGAQVTVSELRSDVRWVRVPDPAWPHPEGRPCIDVAGPAGGEGEGSATCGAVS